MNLSTLTTSPSEIQMPKRERIREVTGSSLLWYDSKGAELGQESLLNRAVHLGYTGVVLYPSNFSQTTQLLGPTIQKIIHLRQLQELEKLAVEIKKNAVVVSSDDLELLEQAKTEGFTTCYRAHVDSALTLQSSIADGGTHDYLMVSFLDPTNIPLELIIASLQSTKTILIKEITRPDDADDALVTLGVMEVGAEGVMFTPSSHEVLDRFLAQLGKVSHPAISIQTATVVRTLPVGMGYRSCIDLATLFSPSEGMLVGSTSQGGILCCPEVFFLPYMQLRPFRVNAGAVHSYVYNVGDKTDYMTELAAGSPAMIVDIQGKVRRACVGRIKTEVRPLRLIEVEFSGGERVNVLMQDDWHVRIFSSEGKPLNITELRPGDKVLGHIARPGRHVGIKVEEHILEN